MKAGIVRSSAALSALAILGACSSGEPGETASPTTGLDGPDRTVSWTPEELYAVGGFSAPEWATFGSVDGVAFDSQGNLYLLDGQTSTITQVSPTGEFIKTISGPGEGPGELAQPMSMAINAMDEIVVSDIGHRGYVKLGTDGEWIENVLADLSGEGMPSRLDFLPDGSIIGNSAFRMSFGGPGSASASSDDEVEEIPEGRRPVHRFTVQTDQPGEDVWYAWDPPDAPEGGESELTGSSGSGGAMQIRMSRQQAFEPQLHTAALPNGHVAVADTTTYRIQIVDPATRTLSNELVRPFSPTPVDEGIETMERDRQIAALEESSSGGIRVFGGGGGMSFDQEAMRNMMLDRIENMVFYTEIPVIERIAADPAGRIWVQRSSGVPGEDGPTDLVNAQGEYLGTLPADGLRIPTAFGPNGLIAVVETDEFDVPTIRVMRVPTN